MASRAEGLLALLLLSLLAKAVMSGQRPSWKRQDPWPWHQHTHTAKLPLGSCLEGATWSQNAATI